MKYFTAEIELENAAMKTKCGLPNVLREIADRMEQGWDKEIVIRTNGKIIGKTGFATQI